MIDECIAQTYAQQGTYSNILAYIEAIPDDSSSVSVQIEDNYKADS